MSVSSEARLGARAGRAQPGARQGREHRFLTREMRRVTGMPLGRGGRPPRLDQGIDRHGDRRGEPISTRRTGALPPGHLRTIDA
jgi:hypothetical protein